MINKEVHPIEKIHFTDTCVRIQEEQIQLGIKLLHLLFHSLGDNVVGNTAKWLQAEHVINPIFCKGGNLTGNQPALPILMVQADNFLGLAGNLLDVMIRAVVTVFLHNPIHLIQETTEQPLSKERQNPQQVRPLEVGIDPGFHHHQPQAA